MSGLVMLIFPLFEKRFCSILVFTILSDANKLRTFLFVQPLRSIL